jgi:hypothetical protein
MPSKAKVGFFGPMKTPESARYGVEELAGGRARAWIEHEVMAGVTPPMLRWWFEHLDGRTTFDGRGFGGAEVPVYRLWHPFDHVAVRWTKRVVGADGHLAAGSVIHIREILDGRIDIDASAVVTRFDLEAFNFDLLEAGLVVGSLDHLYSAVAGGSRFHTQLTIGVQWPLIGPAVTALARRLRFPSDAMQTWIQHNVEESGETEKFVPQLYAHATG